MIIDELFALKASKLEKPVLFDDWNDKLERSSVLRQQQIDDLLYKMKSTSNNSASIFNDERVRKKLFEIQAF